ncbi:MAG: DUF1573 domain-containing protein [Cytophagales bacterium]|nr:DUF1573 domain-containing protein [Cytophagales bacterium]
MRKIALAILAAATFACSGNKSTKAEESGNKLTESIQKLQENSKNQTSGEKAKKTAKFEFEEKVYNFGKVKEGDIVTHVFKFKNTGKQPLIINNIRTTCGCTTPEYTKTPVGVDQSGKITIRFNTKHKRYRQVKTITVFANTDPVTTVLELRGEVTPEPDLSKGPVRQ